MALTDQEKVLQAGILAEKTDTTTNPNMVYSTAGAANKGLNPAYFSGNNTKIVNAMNATYKQAEMAISTVAGFGDKMNNILLNTETSEGKVRLEQLRTDMGYQTLIEGLIDLYENKLPTYITNDFIEFATTQELVDIYNALDTTEPTVTEETQ